MIYLASKSPRRTQLLKQMNIEHQCLDVDIDESVNQEELAEDYVQRMAKEKALAGRSMLDEEQKSDLVLAADTIVLYENEIMGKPRDKLDAVAMLRKLSGNCHRVLTAVALCDVQQLFLKVSTTEVYFRDISMQEMELYWETGEPKDKAGGYAIQGMGAMFIKNIYGSYSGVMGLPLYETSQLLTKV